MFYQILILCAFLANAVAFAPQSAKLSYSALQMNFKDAIGAQPPLGFFDPLGMLKNQDQERFDLLRRYEVKHGRVAMLAVLGHIVTTAGWRCSGDIAFGVPFASMKNGLAALETMPAAGLWQIVGFVGLLEYGFGYQEENIKNECVSRMNEWKWSEKKINSKYAIEVNNGRAAMMGIFGLMVDEKIDNNPYVLNALLGAPVPFNQ